MKNLSSIRDFSHVPGAALIAPSLLSADFSRLGEEIAAAEKGGAGLLHLDIMDGHQVPNLSFGIPVVKSIRKCTKLLFDTHLMITNPLKYARSFRDAGSDNITFHFESGDDPDETIDFIKSLGATAGMSICPGTPVSALLPFLEKIDLVLIMSVEPGFGGQKFMPEALEKVGLLRAHLDKQNLNCKIEIDGGIDRESASLAIRSGADILVAGSSIFGCPGGIAAGIAGLQTTGIKA